MTKTGKSSENESSETEDNLTDEPRVPPEQYPGIRNQTLNQLIFLKRRLVIEFIAEQYDVDYSEWWMTIGESETPETEEESRFGEYLKEHVTAGDVQDILEEYEGCEGKRKAYDYLNTLRELESA